MKAMEHSNGNTPNGQTGSPVDSPSALTATATAKETANKHGCVNWAHNLDIEHYKLGRETWLLLIQYAWAHHRARKRQPTLEQLAAEFHIHPRTLRYQNTVLETKRLLTLETHQRAGINWGFPPIAKPASTSTDSGNGTHRKRQPVAATERP
jgi:hypothetical protein